jgi:Flp pilus assembly protein TadD
LGVIEAQRGNLSEAVKLLQSAFERAPGRSSIGMDLARVFCFEGKSDESRAAVDRVLEFNPDMSAAKKLMDGLHEPKPTCGF